VRLPDGRTIKAKSTTSVRHHIEAGHIPLNSMVRRDSSEEWVNLVWVAEFADLGTRAGAQPPTPSASGTPSTSKSGVAARLDPMRLQTVGVRGLIDELFAALDSTLSRTKMLPAFIAGILAYLGFFAAHAVHEFAIGKDRLGWLPIVAGSAFAVVVLSFLNALLGKLTHLELSSMRPARFSEATQPIAGYGFSVFLANALIAGGGLGLLLVIRKVPQWTTEWLASAEMSDNLREIIFTPILILVFLMSILIWIIVGLSWLLTPAIVVEESSWLAGIREWRQLLRDHFGRIVVYEGLTILLGIAISLPLSLAVGLALTGSPRFWPQWPPNVSAESNWLTGGVEAAIHGLTAAPLLALLAVANVFIYLNLRYEQAPGK
jgi:hypothetical protein